MSSGDRILLTGATGYVGGRPLSALLERGEGVRCLAHAFVFPGMLAGIVREAPPPGGTRSSAYRHVSA
jgi:hypothetical protein